MKRLTDDITFVTILTILAAVSILVIQSIWWISSKDLDKFDSLIDLNLFLDTKEQFLRFLADPGMNELRGLLFSNQPSHLPLTFLFTLPFSFLCKGAWFGPYLFNVFCAVILVISLYKLAQVLYDNKTAILAVFCFLLFPGFSGITRYYNTDLFLTTLLSVSTACFCSRVGRTELRAFLLVALTCLSATYIKTAAVFSIVPLFTAFAILRGYNRIVICMLTIVIASEILLLLSFLGSHFDVELPIFLEVIYKWGNIVFFNIHGDFSEHLRPTTLDWLDTDIGYIIFFYPLAMLKYILLPTGLLLCAVIIKGIFHGPRTTRVLILALAGDLLIFTLIENRRAYYIAPICPVAAILVAGLLNAFSLGQRRFALIVIFFFNITVISLRSFAAPAWTDPIIPFNNRDALTLGYYPNRARKIDLSLLDTIKNSPNDLVLIDCAPMSIYPVSSFYYYARSYIPDRKIYYRNILYNIPFPEVDRAIVFLRPVTSELLLKPILDHCLATFGYCSDFEINSQRILDMEPAIQTIVLRLAGFHSNSSCEFTALNKLDERIVAFKPLLSGMQFSSGRFSYQMEIELDYLLARSPGSDYLIDCTNRPQTTERLIDRTLFQDFETNKARDANLFIFLDGSDRQSIEDCLKSRNLATEDYLAITVNIDLPVWFQGYLVRLFRIDGRARTSDYCTSSILELSDLDEYLPLPTGLDPRLLGYLADCEANSAIPFPGWKLPSKQKIPLRNSKILLALIALARLERSHSDLAAAMPSKLTDLLFDLSGDDRLDREIRETIQRKLIIHLSKRPIAFDNKDGRNYRISLLETLLKRLSIVADPFVPWLSSLVERMMTVDRAPFLAKLSSLSKRYPTSPVLPYLHQFAANFLVATIERVDDRENQLELAHKLLDSALYHYPRDNPQLPSLFHNLAIVITERGDEPARTRITSFCASLENRINRLACRSYFPLD